MLRQILFVAWTLAGTWVWMPLQVGGRCNFFTGSGDEDSISNVRLSCSDEIKSSLLGEAFWGPTALVETGFGGWSERESAWDSNWHEIQIHGRFKVTWESKWHEIQSDRNHQMMYMQIAMKFNITSSLLVSNSQSVSNPWFWKCLEEEAFWGPIALV